MKLQTLLLLVASLLSEVHAGLRPSRATPPVSVRVYDEALCIDCHDFILDELIPAFHVLGETVMDLIVIPFGNARIEDENDPSTLTCQHGMAECDANLYQQCAAAIYSMASRYLPFVGCLYSELTMGHRSEVFPTHIFAECARRSALDWAAIKQCHDDDDLAWTLQVDAYHTTPSEHTYVPWIVVDSDLYDMDHHESGDFFVIICAAYHAKGGRHPACPSTALAVGIHDGNGPILSPK